MPSVREWDGQSYDRISGPMEAMGLEVLARLPLEGSETVLDAGCGSGRITEALVERLPRGRVIALDASASMVQAARRRLERYMHGAAATPSIGSCQSTSLTHVELRQGDLLELELDVPLDAVLSTATFHWISDHDRLFARLHAALSPGGRLTAQCGGEGNITVLRDRARDVVERDPYAGFFRTFSSPWNYAGAEQTRARLLAAGFTRAECWLAPAPTQPEHPREFLSTIVLGPYVQHLPPELRDPFMDEVLEHLGEPVVVDYVRLNIDAVA
jgi:trans-aconitate 2-methyltransferase